mgnify:CR=1 FL=1
MIDHLRFIWRQLVLSAVAILLGMLLIHFLPLGLPPLHFLLMVLALTLITLITYFVMARGIQKSNREGMVILLGGIGLKFILYLVFILIYWSVTKNLTKAFIIAFFLLYLSFTIFMVIFLFKSLKDK